LEAHVNPEYMEDVWSQFDKSNISTPQDLVQWKLMEAAFGGDANAGFRLAKMAAQDQKYETAFKLYQFILDATDGIERLQVIRLNSAYQLAVLIYDGLAGQDSMPAGMRLMRLVAETDVVGNGEVTAATVEPIPDEASPLLELVTAAAYNVGRAHLTGYGVAEDVHASEAWWLKSARDGKGDRLAMYSLGLFYSTKQRSDPNDPFSVIPQNFEESYFWHNKAAESGHLVAAAAIGIMHQHGTGCKKDAEVALKWLKAAADKGCIEAQGHLASHYYGLRLFNKCVQWAGMLDELDLDIGTLSETASKPITLGLYILGRCHERGRGAAKSRDEALRLYTKAASVDQDVVYALRTQVLAGDI